MNFKNLTRVALAAVAAFMLTFTANAQVGIGTEDPIGALEIVSTTGGLTFPRMTQAQRDALITILPTDTDGATTGTVIYQTDNNPGFYYYDGTNWVAMQGVDTDDQGITEFTLTGTDLTITLQDDAGGQRTVDLSGFTNTDDQAISFDGGTNVLTLEDGGTADLSSLSNAGTDNQEVQDFSFDGTNLSLTIEDDANGAQTVDISGVNSDDQAVADFSVSANTVSLTIEDDANGAQTLDLEQIGSTSNVVATGTSVVVTANGAVSTTFEDGGNVKIGAGAADQKLHVDGNIKADAVFTASDARYKKNIVEITDAMNKLMEIRGVTYDYRVSEFPNKHLSARPQVGFIAQELEKVVPELVMTEKDGYKVVDYAKMTAVLVEAVKAQQTEIDMLKAQLQETASLKAEIEAIKAHLKTASATAGK